MLKTITAIKNITSPSLPVSKTRRDIALIISFSAFIILLFKIGKFYIPFYPFSSYEVFLPIMAVIFTGASIGSRRGALATLVVLAAIGIGILIEISYGGFEGGANRLYDKSAGFFWSLPLAAYVTGLLVEKGLDHSILTRAIAMLPGLLIPLYVIDLAWRLLILQSNVTPTWKLVQQALSSIGPSLLAEVVTLLFLSALLPKVWKLAGVDKLSKKKI